MIRELLEIEDLRATLRERTQQRGLACAGLAAQYVELIVSNQ